MGKIGGVLNEHTLCPIGFGIAMTLLGISTTRTETKTSVYFRGTQTNILGIIGLSLFLIGIVTAIISGILIETERRKS